MSEFLWKEYIQMDAVAIQIYDFVNSIYFVSTNDIVVIFSHRGTKTLPFIIQKLPKFPDKLILVGDLMRPIIYGLKKVRVINADPKMGTSMT